MPTPSLPRRYVVAGVATIGLVGGGAVVANAATTGAPGTPAATVAASAPARPATPPTPKPHLDGMVTGVSGDVITIKDHDGFTRELTVASTTTYTLNGKASTSSAVTKGRFLHGDGTVDSNGTSLDATTVAISTSAPKPGGGPGGQGPGGRGPGGPAGPPEAGTRPAAPSGKAPAGDKAASGAPSAPVPSSTSTAHGS